MSVWSKITALPGEAWERIASIPPLALLVTSVLNWIDWQKGYYFLGAIWLAILIYLRLRKEWAKWRANRGPLDDTDIAPL